MYTFLENGNHFVYTFPLSTYLCMYSTTFNLSPQSVLLHCIKEPQYSSILEHSPMPH